MFVTVSVTSTLTTDHPCILSTYNFKSLGSNGVQKDPEIMAAGVSGLLEDKSFYGGSTVKGNLLYLATKGDPRILLVSQSVMGDTFYLALPTKRNTVRIAPKHPINSQPSLSGDFI